MIDDLMTEIVALKRRVRELEAKEVINPCCRVLRTTNRSIADSTWTAVPFGSERYDTHGMHSGSVNVTRITAMVAGKYAIGGNVEWDQSPNGSRYIGILVNGTTLLSVVEHGPTAEAMATLADYQFAVGEYAELVVYQDSGGGLNVLATNNGPAFWMHKIG